MVLAHHGKTVPVADIRDALGSGRDGTTARALLEVGRCFGLRGRAVSIDVAQLAALDSGAILHWDFSHFVVLERVVGQRALDVLDPAVGPRRFGMEEVRRSFTGVALLLEPGEHFEPGASTGSRVIRHARQVLGQTHHLPRIVATSAMLQVFALALPVLTGVLVDRVVPRADWHLLTVLCVGLATLVVFQLFASLVRAHLLLHLRTLLDARMTLGFLDHLVDLPYAFFQRRSTGDLMMRVTSNTTIREILTSSAMSGVVDGVLVVLYLGLLTLASPAMGAIVVGLGAAQGGVFLLTRSRQRELMSQSLTVQARAENQLVEMLAGIETLKSMGSEQPALERYSNLFVDVLNVSLDRGRLAAWVESVNGALRLASPLVVLCYGASLVLDGGQSLGTMLALNALAGGFLGPLSGLVTTGTQLQLVSSYLDRIDDVMQAEREQGSMRALHAPELAGRIEVEHVSFRYGPLSPMVLRDVSLLVEPGQFLAIVGRSGSGKSTLASLLVGLHLPVAGRILYDGLDITRLELRSLRRQVGIVTQRPFLFGTTLRSNIALGDPAAPLEAIRAAAHAAAVDEDILAMPLGYDTQVADGGGSLAGGQRQRVALARALLNRPAILVLDEATSALDAVTEAEVQASLDHLRCTRIVIAHRLSTIVNADVIVVMEEGRIVERGTHAELLAHDGAYARLIAAQLGEGSPPRAAPSQGDLGRRG